MMNSLSLHLLKSQKKNLLAEWTSDTGEDMKAQGRKYLASMGIYIFNRKLLFDLLEDGNKGCNRFWKRNYSQLHRKI